MAAIGANLIAKRSSRGMGIVFKLLGFAANKAPRRLNTGRNPSIFYKAGVPADNTAADAPEGLNDIIIDVTNNDVYRCNAFTSVSSFTVLKIKD